MMNWKKLLGIALSICVFSAANAQAYKVRVSIAEFPNDTIYLVNYFGAKLYYADTAYTNKKGIATFSGNEKLKPGKYSVMIQDKRTHLYEILIDEQSFSMICDTLDRVNNTSFKNSPTNSLYYDYIKYITRKKDEVAELNSKIEDEKDTEKVSGYTKQIQEINAEVKAYQSKMIDGNKDNWAAQLVGMSVPVDIPSAPVNEQGIVIDSMFQYNYYIAHFFDNVPLDNPAIVRTPEFEKKLETYMTKALIQVPDTMIKFADLFLDKVSYDEDLFKFCLHYITFNFEKSKIMGHDAGFVHMFDTYYATGMATWVDSTSMEKTRTKVDGLRKVLIGNQAPHMYLRDTTGEKLMSLYEVDADYTVIYIWDPDCGHCKKENPKVVEFQKRFVEHGVKVWAVGNPYETDEWLDYLKENPEFKENLINVSDNPKYGGSSFRTDYDVHSTPVVMLLDKDKKIKAKQIGIDQLREMMNRELGLPSEPVTDDKNKSAP